MKSCLQGRVVGSMCSYVSNPERAARRILEEFSSKKKISMGTSGFGSVGYPKAFPPVLGEFLREEDRRLFVLTGASTYGMDEALGSLGVVERRYPYQYSKTMRRLINDGTVQFMDYHLGEWPSMVAFGFLDKIIGKGLDIAIVEATKVYDNGYVATGSVGAAPVWVELAKYIIIEVNLDVSEGLEGIHDIYRPRPGEPVPIRNVDDRIGSPLVKIDKKKVLAIIESRGIDHGSEPAEPGSVERRIADNLVEFLQEEIGAGRLPRNLYPLESGVGTINDAVFKAVAEAGLRNLAAWTEVVQDSLLELYSSGVMTALSCTSLMLTPKRLEELYSGAYDMSRIIVRPQDITNNWEVIRRLRVIAVNTAVEVDIYGNVNSTHVMGIRIINGIGGSADFSRNAYLSIFITPSVRKGGKISSIVPMASHIDTPDHDVDVLVTEHGVCDLRGLSPRERAKLIIEECSHPDYKDLLWEYYKQALRNGGHIPHDLSRAFRMHHALASTGDMRNASFA